MIRAQHLSGDVATFRSLIARLYVVWKLRDFNNVAMLTVALDELVGKPCDNQIDRSGAGKRVETAFGKALGTSAFV